MKTYFETLSDFATDSGVRLDKAFQKAGHNSSVYYRSKSGAELSQKIAAKVHKAIKELADGARKA